MMNLSRRGFLIGVSAAAVVAAVPEAATRYATGGFVRGFPDLPMWASDLPLLHYCNPGEWERIKAGGHDMHDCVLVGQIPTTKVPYVRR